ncbi:MULTISPECIES: hypothetical protein [unclassified Novosphingobium]|uniref:hypothetical protein n=1 Tax=unclassified Novosphingobium TaxID=2644732 RepID=UPI00086E1601|nr:MULTISPECIES: hypothetical protein [unclassified Novosphingobium]MBN9145354.1 hypothetical protein [Novosphingobium sp.]MDR6709734.1 hypothetical protein [Novosphingobium sp. 1748]ODU80271.1 MAG: hypothetical protein ABT10_17885 [Novosphingobium sp. SCN 63-17]OJX88791.1 MAG: hypothetical protein BGP00_01830 [Novosphingobium sp. 63-713]
MIKALLLPAIATLASASPVIAGQDAALREYARSTLYLENYDWTEHDLNGDGRPEQFLYANTPEWCGSGGCTLFIVEKQSQKFRVVMRSTVTRLPVGVLPESTKGWSDIAVKVGGGGIPAHMVRLRFNGVKYPSNPSLAPTLPQKSEPMLLIEK